MVVGIIYCGVSLFGKWNKKRKEEKAASEGFSACQQEWDEVYSQLSSISASFTNAHIDPEFVLYKPLVISNAPQAQDFVDNLLSVRNFVESSHNSFKTYGNTSNYEDFSPEESQEKVEELSTQWREINREAEKVGTPILDLSEIRRIKRLWELAANESATTSERSQAMNKIIAAAEKARAKLAEEHDSKNNGFFGVKLKQHKEADALYAYNNLLLDGIVNAVKEGQKMGIISSRAKQKELLPG